jgi:YD repeat-containing protein
MGQTTEYEYDLLNRRTAVIEPEPTTGAGRPTTTYAYDAAGNQASVTDHRRPITRSQQVFR